MNRTYGWHKSNPSDGIKTTLASHSKSYDELVSQGLELAALGACCALALRATDDSGRTTPTGRSEAVPETPEPAVAAAADATDDDGSGDTLRVRLRAPLLEATLYRAGHDAAALAGGAGAAAALLPTAAAAAGCSPLMRARARRVALTASATDPDGFGDGVLSLASLTVDGWLPPQGWCAPGGASGGGGVASRSHATPPTSVGAAPATPPRALSGGAAAPALPTPSPVPLPLAFSMVRRDDDGDGGEDDSDDDAPIDLAAIDASASSTQATAAATPVARLTWRRCRAGGGGGFQMLDVAAEVAPVALHLNAQLLAEVIP